MDNQEFLNELCKLLEIENTDDDALRSKLFDRIDELKSIESDYFEEQGSLEELELQNSLLKVAIEDIGNIVNHLNLEDL